MAGLLSLAKATVKAVAHRVKPAKVVKAAQPTKITQPINLYSGEKPMDAAASEFRNIYGQKVNVNPKNGNVEYYKEKVYEYEFIPRSGRFPVKDFEYTTFNKSGKIVRTEKGTNFESLMNEELLTEARIKKYDDKGQLREELFKVVVRDDTPCHRRIRPLIRAEVKSQYPLYQKATYKTDHFHGKTELVSEHYVYDPLGEYTYHHKQVAGRRQPYDVINKK